MRSLYDNVAVGGWLTNSSTSTATVATGASLDTKGYNTGALRVYCAALPSGIAAANQVSLVALLQESTNNSTWTSALDNTGAAITFTLSPTTTATVGSARIEGIGQNRARYLRVQTTAGVYPGVSNGFFTTVALIELGRAFENPVTTTVSNT